MLGLGGSIATPKGGITADVVVVSNFEELDKLGKAAVSGKIVVYDVPFVSYGQTVRYRGSGASHAAKLGAVAALVRSVTARSLSDPHTGAMRYADAPPQDPDRCFFGGRRHVAARSGPGGRKDPGPPGNGSAH